jgi:arylsulfatase A-like enzyme
VVEKFKQYGKDPKAYGWRGVRSQNHTYIIELGYDVVPNPQRYLYDIASDPQQLHPLPLADENTLNLARQYEQSIMHWLLHQNDDFAALWKATADTL